MRAREATTRTDLDATRYVEAPPRDAHPGRRLDEAPERGPETCRPLHTAADHRRAGFIRRP